MRNLFYFKLIKFKYIEIKSFTIVCLCMCMCVCEKERKENYFLALFFGHIPSNPPSKYIYISLLWTNIKCIIIYLTKASLKREIAHILFKLIKIFRLIH